MVILWVDCYVWQSTHKILEKHKWNIRIVRAKINSEKIELETSYEKSNEI